MGSRLELQSKLETVVPNVYFQPPESMRIKYPCIVYEKQNIRTTYADDGVYNKKNMYQVKAICKDPDNTYSEDLLELFQYCHFERRFVSDNLYHDVLTIYY